MKKILLPVIVVLLGLGSGILISYVIKPETEKKTEEKNVSSETRVETPLLTERIETSIEVKPEKIEENKTTKNKENIPAITLEELKKVKETDLDLTYYQNLAKIYEKMRPQKAAEILSQMNEKEAGKIISCMKEDLAAKVIENLDPLKAREISKYINKNE
jgi:flagellar protein FlbB